MKRRWILLLPLALAVIVAHSAVLYYVRSHVALSAAGMAAILALIVLRHSGLGSRLWARFRRRPRR